MELTQVPDKPQGRTSGRWRRDVLFFAVVGFVLAIDQISKQIVRSTLDRGDSWPSEDWAVRVHHITNTGAAFGILKDQSGFLIVMTIVGLAAILLYYRYPPFHHRIVPIAIGMMLGGAIGNLVDRIRLGRVTDFIDFPLWPAFNVGDASIVIAVIVLFLAYFLQPGRPAAVASPDPPGAEAELDRPAEVAASDSPDEEPGP